MPKSSLISLAVVLGELDELIVTPVIVAFVVGRVAVSATSRRQKPLNFPRAVKLDKLEISGEG